MTDPQRSALRAWLAATAAADWSQAQLNDARDRLSAAQQAERDALAALTAEVTVDQGRPERLVSIDGQMVSFRWDQRTGATVRVVQVEVG